MTVQHRTSRKNSWPAWSGELDDLRRIGRVFVELAQRRVESMAAEFDGEEQSDPPTGSIEQWRNGYLSSFEPLATLEDGDDQVTGSVGDVLAELDRRSVTQLVLKAETGYSYGYMTSMEYEGIQLTFQRSESAPDGESILLTISSRNQGWARQALTQLTEEVEKGVPRWAWFRSKLGRYVIGYTIGIAGALVSYSLISIPDQVSILGTVLEGQMLLPFGMLAVLLPAIGLGYLAMSNFVINWFMPRFEVASQAGSTGGRRLAGLGLLVISIPIGVLVNLIS